MIRGGLILLTLSAACWFGACGGSTADEGSSGGSAGAATGGVGGGTGGNGWEAATCPGGQKQCATGCESTSDPATGCGSMGCSPCALPHATPNCDAKQQCAVNTCDAGWADCNANSTDGCEVSLDADTNHCGSCGHDCLAELGLGAICQGGKCQINCCGPDPWMRDCDGIQANCCETNTATDPANCGTCANVCGAGLTCVSGKCQ